MKKKILVVDDSKAIRFLLQTILSKEYQVITLGDGCSALYWLSRNEAPDLIIADPQLPDMDDWELVRQCFSKTRYRHVPVIVLSGLDGRDTSSTCFAYGVRGYFLKPFNPADLVHAINTLMKKQPFDQLYFNAN